MKRQMIRLSLALLVVLTTALAAWVWSADYDGDPDPKARFRIEGVQITRDRSNAWLEIHLRKSGRGDHDFRKKVRLVTANGVEHEPADNTFPGTRRSDSRISGSNSGWRKKIWRARWIFPSMAGNCA